MDTKTALILQNNVQNAISDDTYRIFIENMDVSLTTLGDKGKRQYLATFKMWSEMCNDAKHDKFQFDLILVQTFLTMNEWSFNTRKVRLAHLRKFAEILANSDKDNLYSWAFNFGRLALLKPKTLGGQKNVVQQTKLSHKQIYKLFDSLASDSLRETRDRAVLGLILLGGLRSSEVVSLKWQHINFEDKTLLVYEGKGDKSAHIPMLGDLSRLLLLWREKVPHSRDVQYVVTWITRGDNFRSFKKVSTGVVSRLVRDISTKTGIDFRPHDARRTIISELLKSGATVPQARDFARHSSGETTLRYAMETDAIALHTLLDDKLKYGSLLGFPDSDETGVYFECISGHGFMATNPQFCPECGSYDLSQQMNLFD